MPAPRQRKVDVAMRRKPADAAVAAAKQKGAPAPPATPCGSFQIDHAPGDKMTSAARAEAAARLQVHPSKLLVNLGPAGGGKVRCIVTAPAEGA